MRRLKIFSVSQHALTDILGCWRNSHFLQLPSGPQIPAGCKVVNAWHSPEHRALMVMLEHESFPEVPDGAEPPHGDFIEYEALERIPVADKFRLPIHDPTEICINCEWFGQPPAVRRFQIEHPGKLCQGDCRKIAPPFEKVYGSFYCREFTRLKYPLPFPSACPPPKITALERWLTVANIEKYTVGCRLEDLPTQSQETYRQIQEYDRQLIDSVIQGMNIPAAVVRGE